MYADAKKLATAFASSFFGYLCVFHGDDATFYPKTIFFDEGGL